MVIRKKHLLAVIITLVLILSFVFVSCGRADSDLGEYTVPDTYTTYTDNSELFSISYPSDWDWKLPPASALSTIEEDISSLNEYLRSHVLPQRYPDRNIPELKNDWFLFYMGEGITTKNYLRVGAVSTLVSYPQGATKEQIYRMVMGIKDYEPFLQETLRIEGNEVAIFKGPENSGTSSRIGIISATIIGDIVWVTVCIGDSQYEKDFQIMVRSLRVLK